MKIAIFYDYFGAIGGGEKTTLTLARALGADIITTDLDRDSIKKVGFDDVNIISLGENPKIPPFKQIRATYKFATCSFPEHDFYIMIGNWSHYAARKHSPNMWYCLTPTRAFYDLRSSVIKRQGTLLHRFIAWLWIIVHSFIEQRSISNVEKVVAISKNTQARIKRYYARDSKVIYPPVPTDEFKYRKNGEFWLSVNRMYPEKRIDVQIEAFRHLPEEKLKIVGWYSGGDHAEKSLDYLSDLPPNIELLGSVSEEKLKCLFADCKAFITTATDEDFGMTPVEAMAAGKPVVATKEGGYLETVIDGVTGRLVEPSVEAIVKAVHGISNEISIKADIYREVCEERAKNFDAAIFIKRMKEEIL